MKDKPNILALILGLIIFGICSLLLFIKAGWMLLLIVYLMPGFVYGILILSFENKINNNRKLLFGVLSTAIYIICVYLLNTFKEEGLDVRLLGYSSIGSILLKLSYDFIISKSVSFKWSFFYPMFLGAIASIPSYVCIYYINKADFINDNLLFLDYSGVFLIYPIWQYLFSLNISAQKNQQNPSSD